MTDACKLMERLPTSRPRRFISPDSVNLEITACRSPLCTRSEPSSLHPSNDTNPSRKREAQAPSSTLPPASLCRSAHTPLSSRDQISAAHLSSWLSPDTSQPCSPPANLWILNPPDSLAEAPSSRLQSRVIANPIYGPACRRRGRWGPFAYGRPLPSFQRPGAPLLVHGNRPASGRACPSRSPPRAATPASPRGLPTAGRPWTRP
jgi:hypothetical protein